MDKANPHTKFHRNPLSSLEDYGVMQAWTDGEMDTHGRQTGDPTTVNIGNVCRNLYMMMIMI